MRNSRKLVNMSPSTGRKSIITLLALNLSQPSYELYIADIVARGPLNSCQ